MTNFATEAKTLKGRRVAPSTGRVNGLHSQIDALRGKKMKNCVMAVARRGLINWLTYFDSVSPGEAGDGAITPLAGTLSRVDSSVRDLAT